MHQGNNQVNIFNSSSKLLLSPLRSIPVSFVLKVKNGIYSVSAEHPLQKLLLADQNDGSKSCFEPCSRTLTTEIPWNMFEFC